MAATTQGQRLPDVAVGLLPESESDDDLRGGYWRDDAGTWWCGVPQTGMGVGNLSRHDVVEHDDGTITVSPSILVGHERSDGRREWHGYLERGVWRSVG